MAFDIVSEVDTSGLMCPIPVLRLRQALNSLEAGQQLRIISTDPGSQKDFASFAAQTGHQLLESTQNGDKFIYIFQKRSA